MSDLNVKIDTSALQRLGTAFGRVKPDGVLARAINHTGDKVWTAMVRELPGQTGLKRKVIVKALRKRRASAGAARFEVRSQGGNISLKFFAPRETTRGVSAAPWSKRRVIAGTFMKGGKFPKRVDLNKGGHAFQRVGGARLPIQVADSGVYIPEEMVAGASAAAFERVTQSELPKRLEHEIARSLSGS